VSKRSRAGVLAAALVAVLSGCTATPAPVVSTTDARPTTPSASEPASPSLPPLSVPEVRDDEIARSVLSETAGTPTVESVISDVPDADAQYAVEGDCRSDAGTGAATAAWAITRADESAEPIASGEIPCDGSGSLSTLPLPGGPVQLAFTRTDGVSVAWVRLIPADG